MRERVVTTRSWAWLMAHGGKECRQDKIDGGMGSWADDGTRSDEIACVVLRQYGFEQFVVPRYMRRVGRLIYSTRDTWSKGHVGISYPFLSLGRSASPEAKYPRRLPLETTRRQKIFRRRKRLQRVGGVSLASPEGETRMTPKRATCSRNVTNTRNMCHSCPVSPHGPEPGWKGGGGPGMCCCPGGEYVGVEFIAKVGNLESKQFDTCVLRKILRS